jgi:hypothetical protein
MVEDKPEEDNQTIHPSEVVRLKSKKSQEEEPSVR